MSATAAWLSAARFEFDGFSIPGIFAFLQDHLFRLTMEYEDGRGGGAMLPE